MGLLNANNADQYNSGINDSDLDIEKEYGYATDEDSVFVEFPQKDEDKVISRMSKKIGHNKDLAATKKQVKQLVNRYTARTKTYEFLVKFKVIVDPADNSSVASVLNASQNPEVAAQIPTEVLEQKHKKKYLRKEASKFHGAFENNKPFWKPINERLLLPFLLELVTKASNLINCVGS